MEQESWAVKLRSGYSFQVNVKKGQLWHVTQASLGEVKKEGSMDMVYLKTTVEGQTIVFGTLEPDRVPQRVTKDLVFDKSFTLTHTSKDCCVYFYGIRTKDLSGSNSCVIKSDGSQVLDFDDEDSDDDDDDEEQSGKEEKE